MGCTYSSGSDYAARPHLASFSSMSSYRGIPRLVLSQSQKVLIKNTWSYLESNMTMIGTQVFLRIFDQNPKIKELFSFRDCWGDVLITHPVFTGHAKRFMTVVKQAVERLDSIEESFSPVLFQLGAAHSRNNMFSSENFALFIQCMLYIWESHLKEKMTPECREAWRTLFHYIMRRLQDGFDASAGISHPHHPPIHIDLIKGQFCHKTSIHHQMFSG